MGQENGGIWGSEYFYPTWAKAVCIYFFFCVELLKLIKIKKNYLVIINQAIMQFNTRYL